MEALGHEHDAIVLILYKYGADHLTEAEEEKLNHTNAIAAGQQLAKAASDGSLEDVNRILAASAASTYTPRSSSKPHQDHHSADVVEPLVVAVANHTSWTYGGRTALMTASMHGHTAVITALIDAKADVNKQDDDGSTALYYAIIEHHEGAMALLRVAGAVLTAKDMAGIMVRAC